MPNHQVMASSDPLILVRNLYSLEDTRQRHAARAARGLEVRITRGAYVDEPYWAGLAARDKYLLTIRAVAETRGARPVLSHWSAAAIHSLPIIGPWPNRVHVTQDAAIGTRSRGIVVRHSLPLAGTDVVEIDGLLVTSVARTVIDLAVVSTGMSAVTSMDAALHIDRFPSRPPLVTLDALREAWDARLPFRGHSRAGEVIAFSVTNSDSPIESVSRWNMRIVGCPPPILQQSHFDDRGFIADTDFSWPEYGAVGEADGDIKYLDPAYRRGRSADQVVLDEKIREDRLRALPKVVARWRWPVALSHDRLRHTLIAAGLPTDGSRRFQ